MKPAAFEYTRPAHVDEACALLAAEEEARIIAGGQTLVPLMAMRLARPKLLVDIARIPDLACVHEENDAIVVGATTRQCVIERDAAVRAKVPLLAKVLPFVGHAATRARGTVGGSLVNADSAAEIVLVAVTLGATLCYREVGGQVEMSASEFFIGPMLTALPAAACLISVRFPVWREQRIGVGFHEVSARRSDFAFVAAAAQIALDDDGRCQRLAVGIGAATPVPIRLDRASETLVGTCITEASAAAAIRGALAEITPLSDLHASAGYRRRVAGSLALRAIMDAQRAAARGAHAH